MIGDRAGQIAYCLEHILPIWERWTDGNAAARRLLECQSADPDSHEDYVRRLLDLTFGMDQHSSSSSVRAARAAASAIVNAYVGVPEERFGVGCVRAFEADALARGDTAL